MGSDYNNNTDAKAAWLQFSGETRLQQNPAVSKALQFYFCCAGLWPHVADDGCLGSYCAIGLHCHLKSHLVLDSTAADAIHLWPPATAGQLTVTGGNANNNSMAGMLTSNCCTATGKRLFQQWLRQPLLDLEALTKRQDAVQELVLRSVGRDAVRSQGLRLFNGPQQDLAKLAATLQA